MRGGAGDAASHRKGPVGDRRSVRRLRAGFVPPPPGRPGTRSGGITTALRGARWTGTGPLASSQETRTQGEKSPRWSAGRRPHIVRCAARRKTGAPSGAPSPRHFGRREKPDDGVPRAAKNRGDDARLHACHSGARASANPESIIPALRSMDSGSARCACVPE